MPKKRLAEARTLLYAMPYAETQAACEARRAEVTTRYRQLAPKAMERLANASRMVEKVTALIWKMLQVAESTFRRLKGAELLPDVYAGQHYRDGVKRTSDLDSAWPLNQRGVKQTGCPAAGKGVQGL